MRKPFWPLFFIAFLTVGGSGLAQAQAQEAEPVAEASEQMTSAAAGSESYADIAVLSQQIALSQRKIQAMELKNNLAALEAQQTTGTLPFKVVRVEGFGDTLYAILSDDTGVYYQVGPGDLVANQYRVSLLRPSAVGLYDMNAHRGYAVPFVLGGSGSNSNNSQGNEFTGNVTSAAPTAASVPAAVIAKQTVASS